MSEQYERDGFCACCVTTTLYRSTGNGTEEIDAAVGFGELVPVKPFDIWRQYDEADMQMPCRLPVGRYAIVRLDDE